MKISLITIYELLYNTMKYLFNKINNQLIGLMVPLMNEYIIIFLTNLIIIYQMNS